MNDFTVKECDLILESLNYTRRAFEQYGDYPSLEFKVARIASIVTICDKVRAIRKAAKSNESERD